MGKIYEKINGENLWGKFMGKINMEIFLKMRKNIKNQTPKD